MRISIVVLFLLTLLRLSEHVKAEGNLFAPTIQIKQYLEPFIGCKLSLRDVYDGVEFTATCVQEPGKEYELTND